MLEEVLEAHGLESPKCNALTRVVVLKSSIRWRGQSDSKSSRLSLYLSCLVWRRLS